MWCAATATVHFSAAVVFFQSASLRFWRRAVASATLASNCLASASPLAPMISPLGLCLYGVDERHPRSIAQATTRRFPLDAEGELGDADVGHSWPCGRGYGRAAFGPPRRSAPVFLP